jgi:hypothetical protein
MATVTLAGSIISLPFLLFVESPQPAFYATEAARRRPESSMARAIVSMP